MTDFVEMRIDVIEPDDIRKQVEAAFANEFEFTGESKTSFRHRDSGQLFRYIPGGQFQMGFSEHEELAAHAIFTPIPANPGEMRPVHVVRVSPFLLGERPILNREIDIESNEYSESAAFVSHTEATTFAKQFGMTLPSEVQWEYACRAGSKTLFTWGDELPSEDELAGWLKFDFANDYGRSNAFGLYGLFVGEWTSDPWTNSYDSSEIHDPNVIAIRGGGAYFWPWQDQEWVWCMSAMRAPSTDLPENKCGFRLVRDFPIS